MQLSLEREMMTPKNKEKIKSVFRVLSLTLANLPEAYDVLEQHFLKKEKNKFVSSIQEKISKRLEVN